MIYMIYVRMECVINQLRIEKYALSSKELTLHFPQWEKLKTLTKTTKHFRQLNQQKKELLIFC